MSLEDRVNGLVKELADEAYNWLIMHEHPVHYSVSMDAPNWVHFLHENAHKGVMCPEVWRSNAIAEVLSVLSDIHTDVEDLAYEYDWSVDVYTSDLIEWVGSHHSRKARVDDALGNINSDELEVYITYAQEREYMEVCEMVTQFLRERAEELIEEEEEGE